MKTPSLYLNYRSKTPRLPLRNKKRFRNLERKPRKIRTLYKKKLSLHDWFRLSKFKSNITQFFYGCIYLTGSIPLGLFQQTGVVIKEANLHLGEMPETLPGPNYDKVPKPVYVSLIKSRSFNSLLIRFGMFLWALLRLKTIDSLYSHCEVRYGELTSGAEPEGVVTRSWPLYVHELKKPRVKSFKLYLTNEQWESGKAYLDSVEGNKYEYANIWRHLVKMITGTCNGSKSAKEIYCFEHALRFLEASGYRVPNYYLNPYEFNEWAECVLDVVE